MRNIILNTNGEVILNTKDVDKAREALYARFGAKEQSTKDAIDGVIENTTKFVGADVSAFNSTVNPAFYTKIEDDKRVAIIMSNNGMYAFGYDVYDADKLEDVVSAFDTLSEEQQAKLVKDVKVALADDSISTEVIVAEKDDATVTATVLGA